MPRKYTRKQNIKPRASWSEADLENAMKQVNSKEMGINEASRRYNIPSRTLRRRLQSNISKKLILGRPPALGENNEMRLVNHIKKLQASGFAPTARTLRTIAYDFAKKLNVEKKFSSSEKSASTAGMHWFYSFMERHPELSIRKSEGLSLARAKGMAREEVNKFHDLLKHTLENYGLINKPQSIFNMDETGIQMNNCPDKVIAEKGSKCVHVLTSKEKGENVSIIACANAEGNFLPPVLILKGVRKNQSFLEGLPAGSDLYMSKQSSYVTSELFFKWLKEIFVPRKPDGPVILILDGHTSHCSNFEMLDYAEKNNIILLCLPSHTTQALQPLDRSFFKPLKEYYKREAETYMFSSKTKNINRNVIGKLIGAAWNKATTITNATSGFSAAGIFPYNKYAIPDYFFQISETSENALESGSELPKQPVQLDETFFDNDNNYIFILDDPMDASKGIDVTNQNVDTNLENEIRAATEVLMGRESTNYNEMVSDKRITEAIPGTSKTFTESIERKREVLISNRSGENNELVGAMESSQKTPSKFLCEIAPLPKIPLEKSKRKQSAKVLSTDSLTQRSKKMKENIDLNKKRDTSKNKRKCNILANKESDDTCCIECLELYSKTTEIVDWIECIDCKQWLHETCTMYSNRCNTCGKIMKRCEKAKLVAKNIKLI